jgi:hypothetical protein
MTSRNVAVSLLRKGDEITGTELPRLGMRQGVVADLQYTCGGFPARERLDSPDERLESTNAAFRIVYQSGEQSEWVDGSRRVIVDREGVEPGWPWPQT